MRVQCAYIGTVAPAVEDKLETIALSAYMTAPVAEVAHPSKSYVARSNWLDNSACASPYTNVCVAMLPFPPFAANVT